MTRVAHEAQAFMSNLLLNQTIAPQLRQRIVNRLMTPSAREADMRAQQVIVLNNEAAMSERIAAVDKIILYLKGDA